MTSIARGSPPNPRMQPTGLSGADPRSGGTLLERSKERRFVRALA